MKKFGSILDSNLVAAIINGDVGILPTDTIYGILAVATNQEAVTRLYALKHREQKPGTVIAADIEQLVRLGVKRRYLKAVEQFWPGTVSVIMPTGEALGYLRQNVTGLAVRIPDDKNLNNLLKQTGPLLMSSANLPGELPAATLEEAQGYFGDSVDYYVSGGNLSGRPLSTVIRIVDDAIEVLQQGAVRIPEAD